MTYVIETIGLGKSYRLGATTVDAVRAVDLRVRPGEFIALMGPSGSGKSTLMHLLGCLDTPSRGEYLLAGRPVAGLNRNERARLRRERIGFVFQAFNLLPHKSALENVALPLYYQRQSVGSAAIAARARALLGRVGLDDRGHHRPVELSGGEQQRVAIARALAANPTLILADEPTGNLDSNAGAAIMSLLTRLQQEGRTIIVVTHDEETAAYAARIIQMRDGAIVPSQAEEVVA